MRPPFFPITPSQLGGDVTFREAANDEFGIGSAKVRSRWVRHTDPALGYRVELEGRSVTYISDHGPGCVPDDPDDYIPPEVLELCDGVDVLIHDAQHTKAEYEVKRHFGHSTIEYAVHVAQRGRACGRSRCSTTARPTPTTTSTAILEHARELSASTNGPDIVAAHEGMTMELPAR